jgi:hypothetical protein
MRKSKHDGLVEELKDRLFFNCDYEKMWLFWEYCRGEYVGEVDLLAFADGIYDFYEVKCNFHPKAVRTARKQYRRFELAFPRWTTNGFLYTSDKRIRLL